MRGSIDLPQFGLRTSPGGDFFALSYTWLPAGGRVSFAQVLRNSRLSPASAGCETDCSRAVQTYRKKPENVKITHENIPGNVKS